MLLMITGLSGAGKSTALHALEDMSFFCTDNLPATMLQAWVEHIPTDYQDAAVCVDIRSSDDPLKLAQHIEQAKQRHDWRILFVDAHKQILQRRFSTLKRKHPFGSETALESAIQRERQCLAPLREKADIILDSSDLNPYEFSGLLEAFCCQQGAISTSPNQQATPIFSLLSFSYQRGLPAQADMVLDMRFLPNPHYQQALAKLTGCDSAVQDFFKEIPEIAQAQQWICQWLSFIWPQLQSERKQYFTLAIGCSGGRHRSVYMVETIAAWSAQQWGIEPVIHHRELQQLNTQQVKHP